VQTFNRRVLERWVTTKNGVSLIFAIPDHPWVKSADKAAVRIAMTVVSPGTRSGSLGQVTSELNLASDDPKVGIEFSEGKISADLTLSSDVSSAMQLRGNHKIMMCHHRKLV